MKHIRTHNKFGAGMGGAHIRVLGQEMEQNSKNGTNFVPKHIESANLPPVSHLHLRGWPAKNRLSEFLRIILGLSSAENAVIDAVRSYQMPKTAAKIAKTAGVNRKMTNRILKSFEKRQLVILCAEPHKRDRWRYNRKLWRL